jgi:hypothetical protein
MVAEEERKGPCPANDSGSHSGDPRIRRIAESIGRRLARAQGKPPAAANDNEPRRRPLKRLPKTRLGFSSCMAHLHRCDERMQRFLRANHIAGY